MEAKAVTQHRLVTGLLKKATIAEGRKEYTNIAVHKLRNQDKRDKYREETIEELRRQKEIAKQKR